MEPPKIIVFYKLLYPSTANYFIFISAEAISQIQRINESPKYYKTSAVKM